MARPGSFHDDGKWKHDTCFLQPAVRWLCSLYLPPTSHPSWKILLPPWAVSSVLSGHRWAFFLDGMPSPTKDNLWIPSVCLFRCFFLMVAFCYGRLGLGSRVISYLWFLPFNFFFPLKMFHFDSVLISFVLILSSSPTSTPHSLSLLAISHWKSICCCNNLCKWHNNKHAHPLAMGFTFSFAVSLKSWAAILFHRWSEV